MYDSSNGNLYVVNSNTPNEASVSVISGKSIIGDISIGRGGYEAPSSIVSDSSNRGRIVASQFTSSVAVISGTALAANLTLAQSPYSLLFDPQNNYVYTANYGDNGAGSTISVISGTSVVQTSPSARDQMPWSNPANGYVYVANYGDSYLTLISGTRVVGNVTVPSGTFTMAFDQANHYVYITNAQAGSEGNVTIISNETVVASMAAGVFPSTLLFDPANQYMYVIAAGEPGPQGDSTVLALSNTTVVGNTTVGNELALLYNPQNQEVYVALYGPNQVAVISGTKIVATINAGEGTSALAYDRRTSPSMWWTMALPLQERSP